MKKRENLPLNYKERLNSRTSFLVSVAVLVVLCLVFNQMDYTMIRQPAAQAKKAADLQKQKEEEAAATTQEVTTATVLAVGDNLVQPSLLASGQSGNTFHNRPQRSQRYRALRHSYRGWRRTCKYRI